MKTPDKVFITTPIYYINDRPHIGHAYSTIAADVLARYYREKIGAENVRFSTGTDENSKKTIEAAKVAGQNVADYTEASARIWKNTWDTLEISYDDFVRTTEPRHIKAVHEFLNRIKEHSPDDLYQGTYEGLYCYRCEAFYKEDELINGKCPIHKTELETLKEDNWFFRLSEYGDKVREWINSDANPVRPESRKNEVLAFIEKGLEDISISRANQEIGIELPFDNSQKIYVWVEALINYLTVAGFPEADDWQDWWNNVTHIVGKDIIKFHCIIWPALLIAAGLTLPKQVFAHGFFTVDGVKISKSLGNSIDPTELSAQFGNDALRYYLLAEIPFGADGDFSRERFEAIYNADLANDLGNLVSRVAAMTHRFLGGTYHEVSDVVELKSFDSSIEQLDFSSALKQVFGGVENCNKHIEDTKPWELYKTDPDAADRELCVLIARIRTINMYLAPFLPTSHEKISKIFADGKVAENPPILFPKDHAPR